MEYQAYHANKHTLTLIRPSMPDVNKTGTALYFPSIPFLVNIAIVAFLLRPLVEQELNKKRRRMVNLVALVQLFLFLSFLMFLLSGSPSLFLLALYRKKNAL
jgi:hypothetical protein